MSRPAEKPAWNSRPPVAAGDPHARHGHTAISDKDEARP